MEALDSFLAEEEAEDVDEEAEAERLAAERKRRREEIMLKHKKQLQHENSLSDVKENQLITANVPKSCDAGIYAEGDDGLAETAKDAEVCGPGSNSLLSHTASAFDDEALQLEAERTAIEKEAKERNSSISFDIFSSTPSELELKAAGPGAKRTLREGLAEGEDPHLQSNWDDGEGYYRARIGEVIQDRFRTLGVVGKGVFSTVLKCIDLRRAAAAAASTALEPELGSDAFAVAIKMIRSNDTMRKASEKEKTILLKIAEFDPQDKKHCVRLLSHFEYRSHIALVFEYQQMNLRETLKKFGKDVGINIGAVRLYARQLFVALKHLADLRVVHADIKLDNILCSGDLKQVCVYIDIYIILKMLSHIV